MLKFFTVLSIITSLAHFGATSPRTQPEDTPREGFFQNIYSKLPGPETAVQLGNLWQTLTEQEASTLMVNGAALFCSLTSRAYNLYTNGISAQNGIDSVFNKAQELYKSTIGEIISAKLSIFLSIPDCFSATTPSIYSIANASYAEKMSQITSVQKQVETFLANVENRDTTGWQEEARLALAEEINQKTKNLEMIKEEKRALEINIQEISPTLNKLLWADRVRRMLNTLALATAYFLKPEHVQSFLENFFSAESLEQFPYGHAAVIVALKALGAANSFLEAKYAKEILPKDAEFIDTIVSKKALYQLSADIISIGLALPMYSIENFLPGPLCQIYRRLAREMWATKNTLVEIAKRPYNSDSEIVSGMLAAPTHPTGTQRTFGAEFFAGPNIAYFTQQASLNLFMAGPIAFSVFCDAFLQQSIQKLSVQIGEALWKMPDFITETQKRAYEAGGTIYEGIQSGLVKAWNGLPWFQAAGRFSI